MKDKLTPKQERFCLNLFQGMSQREAYIKAGYSTKQAISVIDKNACVLAESSKILVRLAELKKKAEDDSVATVQERKQICTQGARGELKEVTVTQMPDGKKITTIRTAARGPFVAELNKMERIGTHESDISINVLVQRIVNNLTVNNLNIEQLSDDELRLLSMGDGE